MSNMVVQTNVLALNSHRNMKNVGATQKQASARLSSGYRVNNAADDAAGLAISEKMRAQIRGLDQASRNAQDGQAMLMTAEGGLEEITNMLQRIRQLAVQGANQTNTDSDVSLIGLEVSQLLQEISDMRTRTQYNSQSLLADTNTFNYQIGPNSGHHMVATYTVTPPTVSAFYTRTDASAAIDPANTDIVNMATTRANLGAFQNRMEYTYRSLDVSSENLADSESRIRNTDMAKEMMRFTQTNVLQQATVSMLAQANQLPQSLLQLLR